MEFKLYKALQEYDRLYPEKTKQLTPDEIQQFCLLHNLSLDQSFLTETPQKMYSYHH